MLITDTNKTILTVTDRHIDLGIFADSLVKDPNRKENRTSPTPQLKTAEGPLDITCSNPRVNKKSAG